MCNRRDSGGCFAACIVLPVAACASRIQRLLVSTKDSDFVRSTPAADSLVHRFRIRLSRSGSRVETVAQETATWPYITVSRMNFLIGGKRALWLILALSSLLSVACTPSALRNYPITSPQVDLVWPSAPQEPRVRMLRSFEKAEDIGIKPGAFSRLVQFFTGKEQLGMVRPYAVAADDDLIVVADPGLRMIHLFLLNESKYELIRAPGEQGFESPVGLALSRNAIFVADSAAAKVYIFDRKGDHRHTISGLIRPTGMAYHAESRRLFVADTVQNAVVVFNESGHELSRFGSRGLSQGQFNFPTSVAMQGDRLLVNDTLNYRIQFFSLDGTPLSSFGEIGDSSGQFAMSKGLAADSDGNVYVSDALSNYVQIFDSEGRFLLSFGGMGAEVGKFRLPAGIHIVDNIIYIADSQNGRVQVFEYLGGEE